MYHYGIIAHNIQRCIFIWFLHNIKHRKSKKNHSNNCILKLACKKTTCWCFKIITNFCSLKETKFELKSKLSCKTIYSFLTSENYLWIWLFVNVISKCRVIWVTTVTQPYCMFCLWLIHWNDNIYTFFVKKKVIKGSVQLFPDTSFSRLCAII